ncbi:MAG: helix-turn-helix domain-containing protein, partial [Oscillospiraceae bacterium]|nr:helix-turn-helix domain-containing protein [Oscillospiraceae bacterium]
MKFLTVAEAAEKWGIAQRTVRNYCANGRFPGAVQEGRSWRIPEGAERPERINARPDPSGTLLGALRKEKGSGMKGGIYHRLQIEFTYNSNHIEGSRLTEDQTRSIFETRTIGVTDGTFNVDDVIETSNHFRCIDLI